VKVSQFFSVPRRILEGMLGFRDFLFFKDYVQREIL